MEIPTVSEQQVEPTGGASAFPSPAPAASASADAASSTLADLAEVETKAPAGADAADDPLPKRGRERLGLFRTKLDPEKSKTAQADAPSAAKAAAKAAVAPPDRRAGAAKQAAPAVASGPRQAVWRSSALALVVVLAAVSGAIGGALATVGVGHFVDAHATKPDNSTLEASVVQMDADIQELKANVEQNAKLGLSQSNSISDRLDLVEKAQAKLVARPAKLSDAMDKVGAASQVAAKDASMTPPAAAGLASAPPLSAPKAGPAKLPTLQGWVLSDVGNGSAVIQNRQGTFEVFAGDAVPGLGRVDAIKRQDGRWVVVTTKGLIVAR